MSAKKPLQPRKRPRQPRAQVTVEAMLEAASRVLATDGFDGLSTNRIAEVAGVSIGSLYQYFPNKNALVKALIEHNQQRFLSTVVSTIHLGDKNITSLDQLVERVLRVLFETVLQPAVAVPEATLIDQMGTLGLTRWFHETILGRYVDEVAQLLAASTELQCADPRRAAYVIVHAVHGLLRAMVLERERPNVDEICRNVAAMVFAAARLPASPM